MSNSYRDKIESLDEHLKNFGREKGRAGLGIEYHVNKNPKVNNLSTFSLSYPQLENQYWATFEQVEGLEDNIVDFNHDLTHNLKVESEAEKADIEWFNEYDPLAFWMSFIEDNIQESFIDNWLNFLEEHPINDEEYDSIVKELQALKEECEKLSEIDFLPENKKQRPDFYHDVKALNETIKDYNILLKDVEEAESEVNQAENERDKIDPDEDEDAYDEAIDEVEEAERKLEDTRREMDDKNRDAGWEWKTIYDNFQIIHDARGKIENKADELMDQVYDLRQRAVEILKQHHPDIIKPHSEQAVDAQNANKNLQGFIETLYRNDDIQQEIVINNKSFELNHLVVFKDDSMAFRNQQGEIFLPRIKKGPNLNVSYAVSPETPKDESSPFSPEDDSIQCVNAFLTNIVRHEFRKTPKYQDTFIRFVQEQCLNNHNFDEIVQSIDDVKKYQNVIKNKEFDVAYFATSSNSRLFEHFNDQLDELIKNHKTEKMVHNFFSNKYKHLINDETYQHFHLLIENDIDKETIQDQLIDKLKAYDSCEEFNQSLRRLAHSLLDWGPESIKRNLKDTNSELIYDDDDKMVVCVNDFEACKKLGTSNWCIARTENFFQSYRSKGEQYIVYDFTKEPKDPESMIGITLSTNNGLENAHLKNDRATNTREQAENIALISFEIIDKQDKPMNNDVIEKSIKEMAKDPEHLEMFLKEHIKTINSKLGLYEPLTNALEKNCPKISLDRIINQSVPNKKRNANKI